MKFVSMASMVSMINVLLCVAMVVCLPIAQGCDGGCDSSISGIGSISSESNGENCTTQVTYDMGTCCYHVISVCFVNGEPVVNDVVSCIINCPHYANGESA
jgi:hypothetical protein